MQNLNLSTSLRTEEKSTLKWFLTLFYVIFIVYDIYCYFIWDRFVLQIEVGESTIFGYILYIVMLGVIPVIVYLIKHDKHHIVKYLIITTFLVLIIINDVVVYFNSDKPYTSGNAVEVFAVLLSPIFVNKRFFNFVSIAIPLKYLLVGIILQTIDVFFPILLTLVFIFIAYIFLNRFQSYVYAVKNSYDEQLQGMVKGVIATLELKDPYTRGHSERVASYAMVLARELNLYSEESLKSFNYACLLHDIGKVNIPDHILMKPGKLTAEEFDIIKTHPVVGAEAVKNVEGLMENISVIRSHHERWDGKGYPDQLNGKDIPLLARIVSIADAFDAMTSSRSYRNALQLEIAYNRIIEGQGTQFDPELVEVFKKVYPKFREIHQDNNERGEYYENS